MARVRIQAGAELDILNKDELSDVMQERDAAELARIRGVKWMRVPEVLYGKAAGGVLKIGEETGITLGPRAGYLWSFTRLVVDGLTAGATPDVVNLYRGTVAASQPPLWQFNGNNLAYTFAHLRMTLIGGETFGLGSVGTFVATGQIRLTGELLEIPAELAGKFA